MEKESNWRMNAGLIGENHTLPGLLYARSTLAARIVGDRWFVVDNVNVLNPALAFQLFVPVGSGVATSVRLQAKPAGGGSPFPYGFTVTPDRPAVYEV